jgi:hypothetical protein
MSGTRSAEATRTCTDAHVKAEKVTTHKAVVSEDGPLQALDALEELTAPVHVLQHGQGSPMRQFKEKRKAGTHPKQASSKRLKILGRRGHCTRMMYNLRDGAAHAAAAGTEPTPPGCQECADLRSRCECLKCALLLVVSAFIAGTDVVRQGTILVERPKVELLLRRSCRRSCCCHPVRAHTVASALSQVRAGDDDEENDIDRAGVINMDSSSHVTGSFWLPRGKALDGVSYFGFHKQWRQSYLGDDMVKLGNKLQDQYIKWLPWHIQDSSQFGEVCYPLPVLYLRVLNSALGVRSQRVCSQCVCSEGVLCEHRTVVRQLGRCKCGAQRVPAWPQSLSCWRSSTFVSQWRILCSYCTRSIAVA